MLPLGIPLAGLSRLDYDYVLRLHWAIPGCHLHLPMCTTAVYYRRTHNPLCRLWLRHRQCIIPNEMNLPAMDFNLGAGFNLFPGDAIRFPVKLVALSHIRDGKYADATSDGFMAPCRLLPCHTLCKK